ncbi:MAG: ATP-binding protein [Tannerella sp.]|jgi:ATP-dependent DNA helicase RecG|nr:ATP-binding protein [Tannerella sp.]
MPEQHNIEYKQSLHYDYLKWIYGFANAQGSKIYIGIDENGKVVGVENCKARMSDLITKSKKRAKSEH